MNSLAIFDERKVLGKDFRIYGTPDAPLFLAKDVALWIEYNQSNVHQLVSLVDDTEKVRDTVTTLGGPQEAWLFTEDGLYEVLMQSRKPIAKEFKREVKQVLKTIRQTGGYVSVERAAEFMEAYFPSLEESTKLLLLKDLQQQVVKYRDQIESQKPAVEFAEHVDKSKNTISLGEMAKVAQNDQINIGRTRLCSWLREIGVLDSRNIPYQKYIQANYFSVTDVPIANGTVQAVTRVTGKGQRFIIKKLREQYVA